MYTSLQGIESCWRRAEKYQEEAQTHKRWKRSLDIIISSLGLRAVRRRYEGISEGWLVKAKIDMPTAFGGTSIAASREGKAFCFSAAAAGGWPYSAGHDPCCLASRTAATLCGTRGGRGGFTLRDTTVHYCTALYDQSMVSDEGMMRMDADDDDDDDDDGWVVCRATEQGGGGEEFTNTHVHMKL